MATQNKYEVTTVKAAEDLDAHQYIAFALADQKVANSGGEASGIIMNRPKNTDHVQLAYAGEIKFFAGEAASAGDPLTVATSGYFTPCTSGEYCVGRAKANVASGSTGVGLFNFTAPVYMFHGAFAWD